ncbi:PrsW family intramembrane metalloprotease [Kitasatospora herbaricolor]|uniref:PrsW family intramembrane metalloprotease n=1 Tax=Kitasatospora herbaricolor TaxID=68217 RepID=A0ABZ1W9N3_9ACTN|nr:PrsW family intramembrane metalloprotease [Kitasatospora herbaricolor]
MSSPFSGRSARPAAAAAAEAPDAPTRTAGTRTIPGPRTRGAHRPLPLTGWAAAISLAPPAPAAVPGSTRAAAPTRPAADARTAPGPAARADAGAAGRRRHPVLRHPALTSVTAGAVLALAGCAVLILHLVRRQTGTTGLFVGLGLALLPLPFVLGALAWLNQTARVPLRHLLFCLAWGSSAATTVAILANGWASDFLIAHQGLRGETLGADFATPLIEESAKGAALLLLLLPVRRRLRCHAERGCAVLLRRGVAARPRLRVNLPPRAYARLRSVVHARPHLRLRPYLRPLPYLRPYPRTRTHPRARSRPRTLAAGIVLGGVTACGFAFTENALYLGRAFTDDQQQRLDSIGLGETPSLRDFDGTVQTFVLRGLLSPFAHPLFTALTGLGLAITLTTGRRWPARLAAPGGLLLAMALHGTWNAAAGLGTHGFLLVYGTLMVPCFAALVSFAVWARARTARHAGGRAGAGRAAVPRAAVPRAGGAAAPRPDQPPGSPPGSPSDDPLPATVRPASPAAG